MQMKKGYTYKYLITIRKNIQLKCIDPFYDNSVKYYPLPFQPKVELTYLTEWLTYKNGL